MILDKKGGCCACVLLSAGLIQESGKGRCRMERDRVGRDLSLTPIVRRRIEASAAILDTPAERVAYQHTVLCQTALPYRNPGDDVREWERQQGAVALKV